MKFIKGTKYISSLPVMSFRIKNQFIAAIGIVMKALRVIGI